MLHLTQHYLAKTKRNKLNSKFNPWYKTMLKKRKIGKEAAMAKSRSVYSFIHRHWGAIRSSRCWNAPHARLVFLYSLSNKKNQKTKQNAFLGAQALRSTIRNMFIRREFKCSHISLTCLWDDTSRFRIRRGRRKSRCRPAENSGFLAIHRATLLQRRSPLSTWLTILVMHSEDAFCFC